MTLRVSTYAALAAVLLAQAAPSLAQARGLLGVLDPETGAFKALALGSEAAGASVTGTFKLTLAVTTKTPVSAIQCTLNVQAYSSTGVIVESIASNASVSGGKATCQLTLPYSWIGATASASLPIAVSFQIVGAGASTRVSDQGVASLTKVPANGSTTSFSVATVI